MGKGTQYLGNLVPLLGTLNRIASTTMRTLDLHDFTRSPLLNMRNIAKLNGRRKQCFLPDSIAATKCPEGKGETNQYRSAVSHFCTTTAKRNK